MICKSCEIGNIQRVTLELTKTVSEPNGSNPEVSKTSAVYAQCDHCELRLEVSVETGYIDLDTEQELDAICDELEM